MASTLVSFPPATAGVLGGAHSVDAQLSDIPESAPVPCFYCLCSVCGQWLAEVPTVRCDACGSRTHITCARDVYSNEWLYDEVAVASTAVTSAGGGTLGLPNAASAAARNRRTQYTGREPRNGEGTAVSPTHAAVLAAASGLSVSPPLSRDSSHTSLLPSPQALRSAAAKIDKEYNYYCHPDCAMGMEVLRNPQFNATLSRTVEHAFAREWARTRESLVAAGVLRDHKHEAGALGDAAAEEQAPLPSYSPVKSPSAAPMKVEGAEESTAASSFCPSPPPPTATASPSVPEGDMHGCAPHASVANFPDIAACHPSVALEVLRLYHQLRAEAWAEYFEQERHHFGHPLFYPPPFLDIARDAALGHVVEAASPQGQAARLYLLDRSMHPVGSAVAIPVGVLTRWQQPTAAPLIKENDSNNFVAEALERIVNDAVAPETVVVYRKCSKEGRVLV
ncbi:hypothetical protein, unknown function [Leishmania infantum JPCM5]|uniref:Uncharacterized protein n=2 Tax=Leishmania infantum TaxID=5671 RepID=A4IB91_LEIIN|nr:hypothetical protein, unknown function [Leishmania infantum JPCM5]CAC9544392.1 hypothetical_protein_-_conserved [Leishmania infantum]CAM72107.1 hypothetical protein, unknown function [Leishmania infantum JPCM5]SUZ46022.1 hypothetical_protein_-_conserved [Leishmania infantum]|eukprot:XP_001469010.1 hypothetical protein, unknown function [Leishmania infantum JPCM5]